MRTAFFLIGVAFGVPVVTTAAAADGEYYMKIDADWELGKIVKAPDGVEKFATCPGGQLYPLDRTNLKTTILLCPDGPPHGPFDVILQAIDTATGQFSVKYENGTVENWKVPSAKMGAMTALPKGTEVFLDVLDASNKEAEVYTYQQ